MQERLLELWKDARGNFIGGGLLLITGGLIAVTWPPVRSYLDKPIILSTYAMVVLLLLGVAVGYWLRIFLTRNQKKRLVDKSAYGDDDFIAEIRIEIANAYRVAEKRPFTLVFEEVDKRKGFPLGTTRKHIAHAAHRSGYLVEHMGQFNCLLTRKIVF